jgi:hypothetical protein
MLNVQQQRHVWEEWLASEMRALYFADLASALHRRQRAVTWATLFTSSAAVAGFLFAQGVTAWVAPVLALATAALSLYSLVAQDQQRAIESANLHDRWNRIAQGYEALWGETWAADAAARLAVLEEAAAEASKAGALFRFEKKRMERWQDHVEQHRVPARVA